MIFHGNTSADGTLPGPHAFGHAGTDDDDAGGGCAIRVRKVATFKNSNPHRAEIARRDGWLRRPSLAILQLSAIVGYEGSLDQCAAERTPVDRARRRHAWQVREPCDCIVSKSVERERR